MCAQCTCQYQLSNAMLVFHLAFLKIFFTRAVVMGNGIFNAVLVETVATKIPCYSTSFVSSVFKKLISCARVSLAYGIDFLCPTKLRTRQDKKIVLSLSCTGKHAGQEHCNDF